MKHFILFFPFISANALAEDHAFIGDEILVTAARFPQALNQSIADATVITAQDIRTSQAPDLLSVLKNLAGVEITQSGAIGKQSSIFMRGTNSDQVLVLLDGVRIDSATTGAAEVDQMMLDQIDRIEMIRGNASSLYGSSAIGGVIQIFTKEGKGEPSFSANAGYGALNTQRFSAGFGGRSGSNQFHFQASGLKTSGISAINPTLAPAVNPGADGYDNTSFSTNLRHHFSADHNLAFSAFVSRGNNHYDNAFALSTSDVYNNKSQIRKLSLVDESSPTASWKSRLQIAQGMDDYLDFLNGVQTSRYQTENRQFGWQNTLQLDPGRELLLGVEHLDQHVTSTTAFMKNRRSVNSLFAGYTGDYGAHQVQVNLRQDRYSDFGSANTGLLGYGYRFGGAWRATVSYSTAFKAPTFNDLYWPLSFGYQGNPNLQPERSRNAEAGLHYERAGQKVDFIYFDNRIDNLIAVNAAGTTVVNINQVRIDGEELSYGGEFGETGVKASLTFQNPRNSQTGQELLRRAKFHSSLAATRQVGKLQLGGEWQHSGARNDSNWINFPATPVTLASYDLVDLTASYALTPKWHVNARIGNLFNQGYMLAYPYSTLGRTVFAGVSFEL